MKLHRFYLGERVSRKYQEYGQQKMWLQDPETLHQWRRVLKFRVGENVGLFNDETEFIYTITDFKNDEVVLEKVTKEVHKKPDKQILLAWSMIKRDNNDFILQKGTELGVTHFVPMIADRSEKTGFVEDRALKIVIEAAEQCGRGDIPLIEEVLSPENCIARFSDHYNLYFGDRAGLEITTSSTKPNGILIGPEGGWSEKEVGLFFENKIPALKLSDLVLRAETAAITAAFKLSTR